MFLGVLIIVTLILLALIASYIIFGDEMDDKDKK